MHRVLLINPHETEQLGYSNPPLGLLYLAGTLIKYGFDVRLVDGCLDGKEAIIRAIDEFKPSMVGITCLTPGRKKAVEIARLVKACDKATIVVFGGVHPTIMYHQMLENYSDIDFIVIGEGEIAFLELAQGKKHQEINGIAYRDAAGIVKAPPREYIQNLDTVPFPAWHLVNLKKYSARGDIIFRGIDLRNEPRVSVVFSRGCKGHCDFCSTWWIWKGWRHRSAANMVDELELLYKNFGIKHFCFADDAMTVNKQATIDLCEEIIARNLHIAFHVTTRTDCVDEVVLEKLMSAGCYQIAFGVETGSPLLLEKMGKENDIENAERAIQLSKKVGIKTTALMIIGNVGEQAETINQTISFLRRAQPDDLGCVGGLWILPGTKLYQECRRSGYIDDDFWLGDEPYKIYTREWSHEDLAKMQQLVFNYNNIKNVEIPMAQIEKYPLESTFLKKWQRYANADVNEYSATTAWVDAQEQHLELMQKIPSCCNEILDLGCGDGWSTNCLKMMGKKAIGVTINPKEAQHAFTKYGLTLVVSDMHDLPLEDRMFDCIYCRESYEHSIAPYIALCEMNRVLRLNGYVLINLPWDDWIREDSHYSVFTPSQMREMF